MALELESLKKAIGALGDVLDRAHDQGLMASLDTVTQNGLKAGAIQHFEFTYELCWKFMKRWLEGNVGSAYVDGVSRRELFRLAAEHHLIQDVDLWMLYHGARNQTSHVYDLHIAAAVFESATEFFRAAKDFLAAIEARND